MALRRQTRPTVTPKVSVDFPTLPPAPKMTIEKDQQAMDQHQTQMDRFYQGLKTAVLDKLKAVQ